MPILEILVLVRTSDQHALRHGQGRSREGRSLRSESFAKNLGGKLLSGSSAVYKGVADGEYTVGLTFEEGAATYVKSKAPVKIVKKEGVISKADGSAIIKGAKNMDNAKKFIDFLPARKRRR